MSDADNQKVGCMADRYLQDFLRQAAAYSHTPLSDIALLAAILKELRGLRADLKEQHDSMTAGGGALLVTITE